MYILPKFKKYDYSSTPFRFLLCDSKKYTSYIIFTLTQSCREFTYYRFKSQLSENVCFKISFPTLSLLATEE